MADKEEDIDLSSENEQEYSNSSVTFKKWETQILQKVRKKFRRLARKNIQRRTKIQKRKKNRNTENE